MLHVSTRIPTPYGWTTVGDLDPGSVVFDEVGYPVFVRRISDPVTEKVYRVGFTNKINERGILFMTEGQNLCTWHRDRMKKFTHETGIKTIPNDWASHYGKHHPLHDIKERVAVPDGNTRKLLHVVPMTFPLVLPFNPFPIPPYILGLAMNLHDRGTGLMRCTESMWEWYETQFNAAGYTVTRTKKRLKRPKPDAEVTFSSGELNRFLNRETTYMNRGAIPPQYLRGSIQQRMELLTGLLDFEYPTNRGNRSGVAVWCGDSEQRLEQTLELVRSLGYTAVPEFNQPTGTWLVRWVPLDNPYRYPKFRARLTDASHLTRNTFQKFCWRVQSVELDSEAQVRAIEVSSPSGLLTVGELFIPVVGGLT